MKRIIKKKLRSPRQVQRDRVIRGLIASELLALIARNPLGRLAKKVFKRKP